jgi:phosphoribosylcarboxyaminoimidazole (NCAIR) mutase
MSDVLNEAQGEQRQATVSVLIGSKSDEPRVRESDLLTLLSSFDIAFDFAIISSDRNPEELRTYCLERKGRVRLVIAIAGGVPNLPIVVKSWLPTIPVIGVPIDNNPTYALAALTTPMDRPVLVSGYGIIGLRKAAYIAKEILSL